MADQVGEGLVAVEVILSDRLGCGSRLITEKMTDVRSVTLGVWVDVGSRDEEASDWGASHFLEHLLFKGTPEWSAAEIAEAVDEVGGDMNAFTTKEYTAFYIRLLSEDLPLGLEVLARIMSDPALRPDEVEAERQVILDEMTMHADEPSDVVAVQAHAGLFPDHPLGQEVMGSSQSVSNMEVGQLRDFFDRHYRTQNMVIAAAGDVEHDMVAQAFEAAFSSRSGGVRPTRKAPETDPRREVVTRKDTEQAHLLVCMRGPSRHDEDRWPLTIMNHVLGGGMSSRLVQEVRERRGLAYSIWSDQVHHDDAGIIEIGVGTSPEHAGEVLVLVGAELDRIGEQGITQRELKVAKGHLRAETLLALEDSGARMSRLGASLLLHGAVLSIDQVLAKIDRVQLEDVSRVAAKMLGQPRTLSVVGPFDRGDLAI